MGLLLTEKAQNPSATTPATIKQAGVKMVAGRVDTKPEEAIPLRPLGP
jgi:hypothetical protein